MSDVLEYSPDGVEQVPLRRFTEEAYLNYSMYVIMDRALPHIGDGLKPVQRRIVYAMSELGLSATAKYKKSARTVGDVLGKFHPHGDSACYEAMVLMAQPFSYRYPLVDGQGNWGAPDDPKSFAAMRYTESRLSRFSEVLLSELGQGTVDWVPNFDGTMSEPSNTDSLTSLLNRSALFSHGQDLVKQTVEQQTDLSILLFDIDHFKHVNDEYGHQIGDSVLVEVTKLVNEAMRARDTFGRLGGEEFVILLPDTNVDKAKAIAVRVTEKVAQHSFNHLGVTSPITLSIGVANIKDTTAVFEDILHAADLAMYQAKQRGRNQMVNYATIAEDQERRIN